MRAHLWPAAVLAASCATLASRSPQALLDADRAFAEEARAHGLQAAFTGFAATDALVLKAGGVERGRAAVEATFAGTENVDLRWEPLGGELAEGGDVGFTWGTWTRRLKGDATGAVQTGRYLTTWRRTAQGYRWTADLGDSDPPRKAP